MHSSERVRHVNRRAHRGAISVASQVRKACGRFYGLSPRRVLLVGPLAAIAGHGDQNYPWIHFFEIGVFQAKVPHYAEAIILHNHVADPDQIHKEGLALRLCQVQDRALFVSIQVTEARPARQHL